MTIELTQDDVALTDAQFRDIQRALNYVRVAELDKTPGVLLALPAILTREVRFDVFVYGHEQMVTKLLTELFITLSHQQMLPAMFRALREAGDRVRANEKAAAKTSS